MHDLKKFLVLTYGFSWAIWLSAIGLNLSDVPNGILILLGAFMPSIMGAILSTYKKDKDVKRKFWNRVFSFKRIGGKWFLIIIGFFAINWFVAVLVYRIVVGNLPEFTNTIQTLTSPGALIGFTLIQILGGPLAEELGWRGYARYSSTKMDCSKVKSHSWFLLDCLAFPAVFCKKHIPD